MIIARYRQLSTASRNRIAWYLALRPLIAVPLQPMAPSRRTYLRRDRVMLGSPGEVSGEKLHLPRVLRDMKGSARVAALFASTASSRTSGYSAPLRKRTGPNPAGPVASLVSPLVRPMPQEASAMFAVKPTSNSRNPVNCFQSAAPQKMFVRQETARVQPPAISIPAKRSPVNFVLPPTNRPRVTVDSIEQQLTPLAPVAGIAVRELATRFEDAPSRYDKAYRSHPDDLQPDDGPAPVKSTGERTNRPATLHIDGAALGRWTVEHLARTLSKPSASMTGIDPRAGTPRSRVTPF